MVLGNFSLIVNLQQILSCTWNNCQDAGYTGYRILNQKAQRRSYFLFIPMVCDLCQSASTDRITFSSDWLRHLVKTALMSSATLCCLEPSHWLCAKADLRILNPPHNSFTPWPLLLDLPTGVPLTQTQPYSFSRTRLPQAGLKQPPSYLGNVDYTQGSLSLTPWKAVW